MAMFSKTFFSTFCALLSIQASTAQCLNRSPGPLAYAPELSSVGGSFAVRSTSPIAPIGITVLSDQLVFEGPLTVDGKLPFLGTVALEGSLPSVGGGNVAHSCGGSVGSEMAPLSGVVGPSPIGPAPVDARMLGVSPLGRGFGLGSGRLPVY